MTFRTARRRPRSDYSFIQPASAEEVRKRSLMMRRWAEFSGGMLGRTPDYLNASIAAMAAAREFFAASDPRFGDNIAQLLSGGAPARLVRDAHAGQSAREPRRRMGRPDRRRPRAAADRPNQTTDRGQRVPDARDARPAVRGIAGVPLDRAQGRTRRGAVRARLRDSVQRAGAQASSAATRSISGARTSTIRSPRASRRWTASSSSTTCWCRGSACFCAATSSDATRCTARPTRSST